MEDSETGLVDADVLAVRWWLEERRVIVAGQLVKTAVMCRSVGSSLHRVLKCCVDFLCL